MSSFSDLVPLRETVNVRGRDFEVRGVSKQDLGQLIFQFPELESLLNAKTISAAQIFNLSVAAVDSVIAAATGKLGDGDELAGIANLEIGEKAAFLDAILRVALPNGAGPFVGLARTLGLAQIVDEAKGLITKSSPADTASSDSSQTPASSSVDPATDAPTS